MTMMPRSKVVAALEEELAVMADRVVASGWKEGAAFARNHGRAGGLALAIGLLTGTDTETVLKRAESAAMEKHQHTEDARELVRFADGTIGWMRPWCDCVPKGHGMRRSEVGAWVRTCCGRPEKHYWLKHGMGSPAPLSSGNR